MFPFIGKTGHTNVSFYWKNRTLWCYCLINPFQFFFQSQAIIESFKQKKKDFGIFIRSDSLLDNIGVDMLETKLIEKICLFEKQNIYFAQEKKRAQKEFLTQLTADEASNTGNFIEIEGKNIDSATAKFFDRLQKVEESLK